jgi:Alw26I/Eco31I/Esp3I family type II restriction m6 adenine DNA methyltransferase
MNHLNLMSDMNIDISEEFKVRATGKYYTHEKIALQALRVILDKLSNFKTKKIKIADPFAGDGRLIIWLIKEWHNRKMPSIHWEIYLFDINDEGLKDAESSLNSLKLKGISLNHTIKSGDSFKISTMYNNAFDIVVTNPPWELLKPDKRELAELSNNSKNLYVESLKKYDCYLSQEYPLSQPLRKFAGWGTNLSRVGAELSYNLVKKNGYCAIILPASFFADDQSVKIRKQLLDNLMYEVAYYPAEAKLFGKADIASASLVFKKTNAVERKIRLTVFNKKLEIKSSDIISLEHNQYTNKNCTIPITLGGSAIKILKKIQQKFPNWEQLEKLGNLWSGREIDETGSKDWLSIDGNGPKFIKGRMIDRYKIIEEPYQYINKKSKICIGSINFERIAWRDVSRPSQKRRIIATIIPKGIIAGNSLGVAYFKCGDKNSLYSLLAIMNSLCFEFQLRCNLATSHISLSAIRRVHLPPKEILTSLSLIIESTKKLLINRDLNSYKIEAIIARDIYGLDKGEFILLLDTFDKIKKEEKEKILEEFNKNIINI